jgi:hypothetical protein
LELKFGAVRHICALQHDGKFEVVQRIRATTGVALPHPKNPKEPSTTIFSAGWPIQELPASTKAQDETLGSSETVTPPRKRKSKEDDTTAVKPADEARSRKRQRAVSAPAMKPAVKPAVPTPAAEGFNLFRILAQAQKPRERTAKAVMGKLSAHYENLGADEKREYSAIYSALQTDYKRAAQSYRVDRIKAIIKARALPSDSPAAPVGSDAEIVIPFPKKPVMGGYGVFMNEVRPKIIADATTGQKKDVTAVSKVVKGMWEGLSAAQRETYCEQYTHQKKAYDEAVQRHKAQAVAALD